MPKIERSVDYTFQAYSGSLRIHKENEEVANETNRTAQEKETDSEDECK